MKITLHADDLWIIQCTHTWPKSKEKKQVTYYMTPAMWTYSPIQATIFGDYDAACAHLTMYAERDRAKKGWADGRLEVMDVVPLFSTIKKVGKVQ